MLLSKLVLMNNIIIISFKKHYSLMYFAKDVKTDIGNSIVETDLYICITGACFFDLTFR